MATNPTASRFTVDNTEEIRVTGGGGAGSNVNITGINGTPPALSNPLPVELSDGTNPFGTAGNPLSVNVLSGGGSNASVGAIGAVAPTFATEIGLVDSSGKLQHQSGFVLTNSIPGAVAIVDANGNQITSFGGGTQYAEGATASPATGTASLWRNSSGQLVVPTLDSSGNVKVSIAGQAGGPNPLEFILEDPETNAPARIDDDGNQNIRLTAADEAVVVNTDLAQAGGVPLAPANSAGAIRTAAAVLSGTFVINPSDPVGKDFPIINNDASFKEVMVMVNVRGAAAGNPAINVLGSLDPSASAWNFPLYVYKAGDSTSGSYSWYQPNLSAGGGVSSGNARCVAFVFGISGYSYVKIQIRAVGSLPVLCAWTATTQPSCATTWQLWSTGVSPTDGAATPVLPFFDPNVANNVPSAYMFAATGAPTNTGVAVRTPNIFKTVQATNVGNTPIWTPTASKKFRLMRYQIVLTDNAAADQNGVLTLAFLDAATNMNIAKDFYVQSSVASGAEYIGPWEDLGNGILSAVANNVLNAQLSAPLRAGNFRINVCGTEE